MAVDLTGMTKEQIDELLASARNVRTAIVTAEKEQSEAERVAFDAALRRMSLPKVVAAIATEEGFKAALKTATVYAGRSRIQVGDYLVSITLTDVKATAERQAQIDTGALVLDAAGKKLVPAPVEEPSES